MREQVPVLLHQVAVASFVVLGASMAAAQSGGGVSLEVTVGAQAPGTSLAQHLQSLSSPDPAVRLAAVQALGALDDPAAVAPLSQVARSDPRPEVRGWALRSLYEIGTAEAIVVVRAVATNDTDERVRTLGAQIVASIGPAPVSTPAPAPPPVPQPQPQASTVAVVQQPVAPVQAQPQTVVVQQPAPVQPDLYALQMQRRAGRGLRISGWVLFGTSYGSCFLAGIFVASLGSSEDAWPLFIPAVGPFISAGKIFGETENGDPEGIGGAFAIIAGLMQVAGITMFAVGYARRSRAMRRGVASAQHPAVQVALVPGGPGDGPGLRLAGTF